jgi:hypothetical protein
MQQLGDAEAISDRSQSLQCANDGTDILIFYKN